MKSKRKTENKTSGDGHSIPRVFVQVPDIGYCIPGIQIFCGNPKHVERRTELAEAMKAGGVIVPRKHWKEHKDRILAMEG